MCLNTDSEYLWDNYARENGYNIIFDKKAFVNSLFFYTASGERKDESYIKHSKIIYDTDVQIEIIKNEIKDLIMANETEINDSVKMEYILQHLMYIGNFYKQADNVGNQYKDEQEYRFLITTVAPTERYPDIKEMLPEYHYNEKNNCHYNIFKFDRKSIKTIVCNSERAKDAIGGNLRDIPIEIRNK